MLCLLIFGLNIISTKSMPTIKISKDRFNKLMGEEFTLQKLEDLGFEYGIEIEEDAETEGPVRT